MEVVGYLNHADLLLEDEFFVRFAGSRENLSNYLQQTTVH